MNARVLKIAAPLVTVLFWGLGGPSTARAAGGQKESSTAAQPNSDPATSTAKSKTAEKPKHWNGSLVDVGCMAKALGPDTSPAGSNTTTAPYTSHFAGPAEPSPQAGQAPGGVGPSPNPGPGGGAGPPTQQYPTADTSAQDQERAAQQARLDNATKQCTATPTTRNFGLAMSDGQVVQFDTAGNAKASEALKEKPLDPGKKVKAKVEGTLENSTTVNVASVDIKAAKAKRPVTQ